IIPCVGNILPYSCVAVERGDEAHSRSGHFPKFLNYRGILLCHGRFNTTRLRSIPKEGKMFERELNELEATELAYKKANDFLDDYMKERGGHIYLTELGYIVFAALLRARQHLRTDELA